MRRSRPDSRIEIWSAKYINQPDSRYEGDKRAIILQIEYANGGDYIVEVVDNDAD